jgi:hypothetical protein
MALAVSSECLFIEIYEVVAGLELKQGGLSS